VSVSGLRKDKGVSVRIKGSLQATQNPNVPNNNNTGIILSIIPVVILFIILYHSISIENTDGLISYCTCTIVML
jgi:hypothetical protein